MKAYIVHNNHGIILGAYLKKEDAVARLREEWEALKAEYAKTDPSVFVEWIDPCVVSFFDPAMYDDFYYEIEETEIQ